jgi:hypothetical protein
MKATTANKTGLHCNVAAYLRSFETVGDEGVRRGMVA